MMPVSHQNPCYFQREMLTDVVPVLGMLFATYDVVRCCAVIRPCYLQRASSSDVMPAYAQLVGNIGTFPGIEKAHGRYALPRAVCIFVFFHLNYITGQ